MTSVYLDYGLGAKVIETREVSLKENKTCNIRNLLHI